VSDPRAVLQGIQERASKAGFYIAADMDAWPVGRSAADVPKLVAAFRAVLTYADSIDHPDHGENAEREQVCDTCRIRAPFRGGAYWPCVYRRHAEEVRAAITEALGGADD